MSTKGTRIRGLAVVRSGVSAPVLTGPATSDSQRSRSRFAKRSHVKTRQEGEGEEGTEEGEGESEEDDRSGLRDEIMVVDFSRFGTWYEIDSWWEGHFLERTVMGSFTRTIEHARRDNGTFNVKALFNHGFDMTIHNKVLGVPNVLEEHAESPHMEVPLLDTSYNADLVPGLRNGAYGSSFMFEVLRDDWNYEPGESDHNPDGIPERTITEVRLFEAGPVTWPANPEATAGLRSNCLTDGFMRFLHDNDPARYDDFEKMYRAFRSANGLATRDDSRNGTPEAKSTSDVPAPADSAVRHTEREKHIRSLARKRFG